MGTFRLPTTDHPRPEGPARPVLGGPTGLGTAAVRLLRARDRVEEQRVTVPELYCPDAVRDDPALGAEVNDRLVTSPRYQPETCR